jgi:hypothetical protein
MRGRIRLAAVGIVTLTVIGAMTSVAGATTTVSSWNVKANSGALDADGVANLELLPVAGAGGLLGVSVNDVSASASASTANSSASTSPNSTPTATPAAAPATAPAAASAAAPAAARRCPA